MKNIENSRRVNTIMYGTSPCRCLHLLTREKKKRLPAEIKRFLAAQRKGDLISAAHERGVLWSDYRQSGKLITSKSK